MTSAIKVKQRMYKDRVGPGRSLSRATSREPGQAERSTAAPPLL